jgi:3-phenylpropionate/trans-cinnamate dioxygenase ferredoxin subunit
MEDARETTWIDACGSDDVEPEDVIQCEVAGKVIAIYRSPEDTFHATDGLCTHEHAYLADGLVMGHLIECPKHNGRFNYKTGEAKRAPVCVDLRTYPVRVEAGRVLIDPHPAQPAA